ncbi:MAG TPA: hypothetical protein VMZ03_00275 [Chitinophagaceae bacterium]|nr:hypothetical protein [Chitinophagaceae bacterium]
MKRIQLIEYGIIVIGLIFGFKFFESVFSGLVQLFYFFQAGGGALEVLLPTVIMVAIYGISFITIIRRSSQIAVYLSGKNINDDLALKMGKRPLLRVILIGICVAAILSNLAEVILYLFETFRNEVGRGSFYEEETGKMSNYAFKLSAIKMIFAVVILYFAKDISYWLVRRDEVEELTFDSDPEK